MAGGFIVLAGIVLGVIRWWLGSTFASSAWLIFLYLLTGGLLVLMSEGLRSGKLGIKGGYVYRDKHPTVFWIFMVFYGIVESALLIGCAVFTLMD